MRSTIIAQRVQNKIWFIGKKALPRLGVGEVKGRIKRISRAANIATTPPNLLGIERRMA